MSKYKPYGKTKASGRGAGNQFDKLLKACSNSKGALGRFGGSGTHYGSSTRTCLDSTGEDEQTEKTSRFSSLNKRPRLEPFASSTPTINTPTSLHYATSIQSSINDPYSRIPVASTSSACVQQTSAPPPPLQTVMKPRKFFKSRGPIEVEVDPNNIPKPLSKPDASPTSFNSNPILGSNQAININNSHSISSYYQNNNSKGAGDTLKGSKNATSPPANNSSKSFSSVCSPPIKLRIIKDKTTSKFVSVADGTPSPVAGDAPEFPGSHLLQHGKKPKKRGRERKTAAKNNKVDTDDEDEEQLPVLVKATSKSKSRKGAKEKKPPKLSAPSPPRRSSGRITRSSMRHNDDSQEEGETSDAAMNILEQENLAGVIADHLYNPPAVALRTSMESEATLRKLEEDAEFQKLSQMLSSMEAENSSSSPSSLPAGPSSIESPKVPHHYNSSLGDPNLSESSTPLSSQQGFGNQTSNPSYQPVNLSSGIYPHSMPLSGGCESESESSKSYKDFVSPPAHGTGESSSGAFDQRTLPPEKKDMRSILEDDWNDSYDDDSPRKAGSPPKVSRFDASAFTTNNKSVQPQEKPSPLPDDRDSDSSPILDIDYSNTTSNRRDYSSEVGIQRPIPVYGNQFIPNMAQPLHQQQPPFNINTSPYAMRNLLGGPLDSRLNALGIPGGASLEEKAPASEEPQNLVCSRNAPNQVESTKHISGDNYSEFGSQDTVNSNMDSQGTDNRGNSQESTSSVLSNSQSSTTSTQLKSSSFKKASIFKSRAATKAESDTSGIKGQGESNKKRLAVYKHTFGQQDKDGETERSAASVKTATLYGDFDDEFEDEYGDARDDDPNLKLRRLKITNSQGIGGYSSKFSAGSGDDENISKVTCKKEVKKLFTVVRNVKAGHELQESGEFHEFDGDVWYILEDLKDKNPMTNRCLSAITLATRCMDQAFRMHLRAHGTVAEFCQELHDAPQHPVLSLLAATVLFVLSQDRLNMDLDTESLKLILALIKSETGNGPELNESSETTKNRQRVTDLCFEMKNRGHAKHLKLDKITASELALETLLYLTSKRAGEWVKHELRSLGGLDSIVDEVDSSFRIVKEEILTVGFSETVLDRLSKVDRCLQVLQQVTFNHEDNQRYIMQVSTRDVETGDGQTTKVKCTDVSPNVFLDMFKFCRDHVQTLQVRSEATTAIREILFSILRLLVNLSHDYRGIVLGSEILMKIDGFLELSLHSTFQLTSNFPDEKVFDLLMHSLCLLLNLVEYSKKNRGRILQASIRKNASGGYSIGDPHDLSLNDSDDSGVEEELPVLDALIHMFMSRERSAKKEEQHTDNILTTGDTSQGSSGNSSGAKDSQSSTKDSQDTEGNSVQDTIDKLIQTAGKHMENSLIAAYISLLIGYLIMDDPDSVEHIRNLMPDRKFLPLMAVLKKLFNFMSITSSASGSIRGLKATAIALKFYAKADPASDEELKKIIPD